jgi:hypothetical protein
MQATETTPITQAQLLNRIAVRFAGRAAEECVFGEVSSLAGGGDASNDLAQATTLASDAIARFGLSQQFPLFWHAGPPHQNGGPEFRDEMAEVKAMLEAAYAYAKTQIEAEAGYLVAIAEALIEHRALSHHDLIALDGKTRGPTVTDDLHARLKSALDRLTMQKAPKFQKLPVAKPVTKPPEMALSETDGANNGDGDGLEGMTREALLQEGERRLATIHGFDSTTVQAAETTQGRALKKRFLRLFERSA